MLLATALLGSAAGVLRMRAWGILLGALTSVVTLVAAALLHNASGLALALAAIPGFMMLLPVLIAKRERARADAASSSFTRVASHVSYDDTPVRVRVASGASDEAFGDDEDDARPAAPLPAARAQA